MGTTRQRGLMTRGRNLRDVRLVLVAFLALLTALPSALAVDTLASFQEPRTGTDQVFDFLVQGDEARNASAVLFLNPTKSSFEILVYAENGTVMFDHRGGRGIQTLPPLEPGRYRFFLRGAGTFAATSRHLAALNNRTPLVTDVERKLAEPAEGYVFVPLQPYEVHVDGNVTVDWMDMTKPDVASGTEHLATPVNRTVPIGKPAYLLVRGAVGTPYTVHLNETTLPDAPTPSSPAKTPLPGAPLAALGLTLAAWACRRRMRGKD